MTNTQLARELFASINASRAEHAEEGRAIHEQFLSSIQSSDVAAVPDPLVWSDELAGGATEYAERCARWRQVTHDDLENGSSTLDRIRLCVQCSVAAENLACGSTAWLTPTRCHEQFMSALQPHLHTRENVLNPAFTHAGIGIVEEDGIGYYVVSFARIDPNATIVPTPIPQTVPVWVVPLWEPEPVRWRIALTPDGPDLRTQLARRFSIDGRRLVAVGLRDGDPLILERKPTELSGQPLIAISLAEFEPKFISLRPRSSGTTAPAAARVASDPARATPLELLTPHEEKAVDVVRVSRAAPSIAAVDVDPALLMPPRRPGSPVETIITQLAVDVRPENDDERQVAMRVLSGAAKFHESLIGKTRYDYDLRQELSLGLERDLLLRDHQRRVVSEAMQSLSFDTAASPLLYAVPYDGDDGHAAFIAAAARRAALLQVQDPVVTNAFLDAYRLASHRRVSALGAEPLLLSTYRTLSFIAVREWENEIAFWVGVERSAAGIFRDMSVLPVVCEGDAKEIVARALDRENDEDHPLRQLETRTRDALLRRLTRIEGLPVSPLDTRRRKDEPKVLGELTAFIDDPIPIIESIPEARALLQEAMWLTQSRLRSEIERMYLRYRAGDEGRNMTGFVRMLKLVAHHLGAMAEGASPSEHIPLTHRVTDAAVVGSTAEYRQALQPLLDRYLRRWRKRLIRFLLPRGRSKIHADLRPSVNALAASMIDSYWSSQLRHAAATRAFALPLTAAMAAEQFARDLVHDLEQEARVQRGRLERFLHDPTAVVLGASVHGALRNAERSADRWWSQWLAPTRERKWMQIGAAVLGNALGQEESPFALSVGRTTERLIRAVGKERGAEAAAALSDGDIRNALALMFDRSSFRGVLNEHRLTEVVARDYPQQPSTLPQRTTWIVIIGRPLAGSPAGVETFRTALTQKRGTHYDNLICVESPSVSGIHFIAECHGLPADALAL